MKLKTHQKIFVFSILVVAAIALLDILAMNSTLFATAQDYVMGNFSILWWPLFLKINLVMITLISLAYYWFARKDKSETISLWISSVSLWLIFGLADLLFFWMQAKPVPETLTWLTGSYVGRFVSYLGFQQVTNTALYLSIGIGLIFNYFLTKFLVEKL